MDKTDIHRDLYRSDREMVLVALGGNALIHAGESGTVEEQERNAEAICGYLMTLVERDYNIIITHGNGPQVGQQLIRHERAGDTVPKMPLDVLVAETEGNMGYFLQQTFLNHLKRHDIYRYVATLITQVIVERDDPAFQNPSKPIGTFMTKEQAEVMQAKFNWKIVEDAGRGYRRVVPSPTPVKVVQRHVIRHMAQEGNIVIAGGGGGIPIWIKDNGDYEGIEAVIDKDLTSAVIATETGADMLIILMPHPKVAIGFETDQQVSLDRVSLDKAKQYMREGHFPAGSIGPKIQGVINFLEASGKGRRAIITRPDRLDAALDGQDGTEFYR
ncbi:MAG: carbamate kinase [Kiritimatiellae bacterium]|nr:carbamate kinase [Verrucomicrobiota bacterium]MCG2659856.1 carbamate kinase [Kiritimatiellia bacterium]